MVAKRIIPCLDVCNNQVVKGVQFRNHRVVGSILELAENYSVQGADELVFYDIKASASGNRVGVQWINQIAATINIPFTVAGGIRSVEDARIVLKAGADKISINSPALENPDLINELSTEFGAQCVVIGIDSQWQDSDFYVYQYTGDETKSQNSKRKTRAWIEEVQNRGAGEIVLNCMQADGVRNGYDLDQLQELSTKIQVPLIASGGAGKTDDFVQLFQKTTIAGALAASVFHDKLLTINEIKQKLRANKIEVRL